MDIKRRTKQAVLVRRLLKAISDYDKALLFGHVVSEDTFNVLWNNIDDIYGDLWESTMHDPTQEPENREYYAEWAGQIKPTGGEARLTAREYSGSAGVVQLQTAHDGVSGLVEGWKGSNSQNTRCGDMVPEHGEVLSDESERRLPRFCPGPNSAHTVPAGYEIEKIDLLPANFKEPQPSPKGMGREITPLVLEDLKQRSDAGLKKYGERLHAWNGRSSLRDAYEEVLDLAQYLRQAIEEEEDFFKAANMKLAEASGRLSGQRYEDLHNKFVDAVSGKVDKFIAWSHFTDDPPA